MATIKEIEELLGSRANYLTILENLILKNNGDIISSLELLDASVNGFSTRLSVLEGQITTAISKINSNSDAIQAISFETNSLEERIAELEKNSISKDLEIRNLEKKIDEQIDRNLRETLVINGVEGRERDWEGTRKQLSIFLEELSDYQLTRDRIYKSIVRAHRGAKPSNAIFVKFNDGNIVSEIKTLNFKREGIYINQLRSPLVTDRIKEALAFRKTLKDGDGKNWKMFINDRLELMIKRPDDAKYTRYKSF